MGELSIVIAAGGANMLRRGAKYETASNINAGLRFKRLRGRALKTTAHMEAFDVGEILSDTA